MNIVREISKKLNVNPEIIKRRWKNLKDQYRKDVKRLTQTGQPSTWQHLKPSTFSKTKSPRSPLGTPRIRRRGRLKHVPPPKKKRLDDSMREELVKLEQKKLSLVEKQLTEQESLKDEDYLYMMSVLPYMRGLNLAQKLRFRGKINQWLLDTVTSSENIDESRKDSQTASALPIANDNLEES